jgi:mRNA interferase HigB
LTGGSHCEDLSLDAHRQTRPLVPFWQKHSDAKASLEAWYGVVRRGNWKSPAEMKQVYHNADLVGRRTVFNIAGNKYRLIVRVNYFSQRVFVLFLLTHSEHDKGAWKQ